MERYLKMPFGIEVSANISIIIIKIGNQYSNSKMTISFVRIVTVNLNAE
jgi:hypothetical protein